MNSNKPVWEKQLNHTLNKQKRKKKISFLNQGEGCKPYNMRQLRKLVLYFGKYMYIIRLQEPAAFALLSCKTEANFNK